MADAKRLRAEEPDRYAEGLRRRIDIAVVRPFGSTEFSNRAAFKILD